MFSYYYHAVRRLSQCLYFIHTTIPLLRIVNIPPSNILTLLFYIALISLPPMPIIIAGGVVPYDSLTVFLSLFSFHMVGWLMENLPLKLQSWFILAVCYIEMPVMPLSHVPIPCLSISPASSFSTPLTYI